MAETTKTVKETKETIFIPRDYAGNDEVYSVCVNGKRYNFPRGKESTVPSHIAAEIHRARRAEEALIRKSDEMVEKGKEPIYKI